MSESFKKSVAAVAAETETAAAVATPAPTAVAKPAATGYTFDDIDGSIERSDIQLPKLNVAQKIGPLSDDFPAGAWVLNRTVQVAAQGEEVFFTPIKGVKKYIEALEYGSDVIPRVFNTRQEAADAGLRVEFTDGERPEINDALDVILLLRSTGQTSPEFCLEFGGESYALAMWSITGFTAYNAAARTLLTARTMYLKSLDELEWVGTAEKHTLKNGNTVMRPKLVKGAKNPDDFREWAASLVG